MTGPITALSIPANVAIGIVDRQSAVVASVLCAAGLFLLIAGQFGLIPSPGPKADPTDKAEAPIEDGESLGPLAMNALRASLAVAGSGGLYLVSGWIAFAGFGALAGWAAVPIYLAKRDRRRSIDRVEAIATWVEAVRDNITGGAGLQQALRASAVTAPDPIRAEVRDLALRLQHQSVVGSLRRFAADLAHPTSDIVVGSLILATTRSAGSLASVLANAASAARDNAAMHRQVDASRVSIQSQGKIVGVISSLLILWMTTSNGDFVEPYNSAVGQVVLSAVCAVFSGSVFAMHRLGSLKDPVRVFVGVEKSVAAPDGEILGSVYDQPVEGVV